MRRLLTTVATACLLASCAPTYYGPSQLEIRMNSMNEAQKTQLRAAALQCKYEAHAQAANFRGEIIQAAEERNLGDMCLNAALARIEAMTPPSSWKHAEKATGDVVTQCQKDVTRIASSDRSMTIDQISALMHERCGT